MDIPIYIGIALTVMGLAQALLWWYFSGLPERIRNDAADQRDALLPPVSIVLCARNAEEALRANLPAVLDQDYPVFEVIVVDDASSDGTALLLERLRRERSCLRVLRLETKRHPGKKEALSAGIRAARYAHLLVTDADCRPASRNWAKGMLTAFARLPETELVLGYSPPYPFAYPTLLQRWVRFETFYTALLYVGMAHAGRPYMGVGRNLAIKKASVEQAGGFSGHAHLVSGDDDLLVQSVANRRNTAVCLDANAWTWTEAPGDWRSWLRQKRRHLSAGWAYRGAHQSILAAIAVSQAGFWALLVAAAVASVSWTWILALYLLRFGLVARTLLRAGGRMGCADLGPWAPVLDGMLGLYYGLVVPVLLYAGDRGRW